VIEFCEEMFIYNTRYMRLSTFLLLLLFTGCTEPGTSQYEMDPQLQTLSFGQAVPVGNPLFVPITDQQSVSDMAAEVIDDYFKIAVEEPVRLIGNSPLAGKIETFPEISPTLLEPWRADTASYDQRLDNTLQTYRRRAVVHILPGETGHWIDVAVFLELLDKPIPEHASSGAAMFRYDSGFTRVENPIEGEAAPEGWIPKGRDAVLEQRILGHLQLRAQEFRGR
jgi:hypothetical protein